MYKLLGTGTTSNHQLAFVGRRLFKSRWVGVHPSDVKKRVLMSRVKPSGLSYGIINVDGSSEPGSHWLSIIFDHDSNRWYLYDSYARRSKNLIPSFIKTIGYKYMDLNKGSDQYTDEDSCGARSMAVLLYVKTYGLAAAGRGV